MTIELLWITERARYRHIRLHSHVNNFTFILVGVSVGAALHARSFRFVYSRNRFQLNPFNTPFAEPMHERRTLRIFCVYKYNHFNRSFSVSFISLVAQIILKPFMYPCRRNSLEIKYSNGFFLLFFFKWASVLFTQMRLSALPTK